MIALISTGDPNDPYVVLTSARLVERYNVIDQLAPHWTSVNALLLLY